MNPSDVPMLPAAAKLFNERFENESKDVTETWWGDSIGHWEGDTLVVDTTKAHIDKKEFRIRGCRIQNQQPSTYAPYPGF